VVELIFANYQECLEIFNRHYLRNLLIVLEDQKVCNVVQKHSKVAHNFDFATIQTNEANHSTYTMMKFIAILLLLTIEVAVTNAQLRGGVATHQLQQGGERDLKMKNKMMKNKMKMKTPKADPITDSNLVGEKKKKGCKSNKVVFNGPDVDIAIKFDLDFECVGKNCGECFKGATVDNGNELTVDARRKKDADPAAFFKRGIDFTNTLGLDVAIDAFPDKLNFFINGTMTFTIDNTSYSCPNFGIAQGSKKKETFNSKNNWWLGSSDCQNLPDTDQLVCCCGNKDCDATLTGELLEKNKWAIQISSGDGDSEFDVLPF
jgi:hypothetical protein